MSHHIDISVMQEREQLFMVLA